MPDESSWFNTECYNMMKNGINCLRHFTNSRDSNDFVVYQSQPTENTRLLKKKRSNEENARVDVLLKSMNKSKDFWGEIRKLRHTKFISSDISEEEWLYHFKKKY